MKSIVAVIDKIAGLCGGIGVFLVIALTAIMGWEVVMRYVLHSPTKFAFDSSQMIQVYLALLAANYVLREERHIVVELVLERMPERWLNRCHVVASLLSFVYCAVLVYLSWLMAMASLRMGERTMVMEAPVFPLKLAVAVGFALFGIQFLARAYKYGILLKHPVPSAERVRERVLVSEV